MRCMMCDAEMILMKVIEDETMAVPGFERRAYMCSVCHDTESRLVFNNHAKERDTEALPVPTPPPITPALTIQNQRTTAQGGLVRLLADIGDRARNGGRSIVEGIFRQMRTATRKAESRH
jgi:hypothetical protein